MAAYGIIYQQPSRTLYIFSVQIVSFFFFILSVTLNWLSILCVTFLFEYCQILLIFREKNLLLLESEGLSGAFPIYNIETLVLRKSLLNILLIKMF